MVELSSVTGAVWGITPWFQVYLLCEADAKNTGPHELFTESGSGHEGSRFIAARYIQC